MMPMGAPPIEDPLAAQAAPTGLSSLGAPAPELGVGYAAGNPVFTDPKQLEAQFFAIQKFNETSQLPPIPDPVTLEFIASPDLPDVESVNSLLYGLETDIMSKPAARLRVADAREEGAGFDGDPRFAPEAADLNQLRRIRNNVGGWPGNRPKVIPSDPSAAVISITLEAMDAGILDEDYEIDGQWTPQLREAAIELQRRKTEAMVGGDRFGAVSPGTLMDTIDKYLSPTALMSAAVAMDFLPNLNAIKKEGNLGNWFEKIGDWASSPENLVNPKKFVGALGPIDDILFPVINTAMLASGVGGVIGFSRIAIAARAYGGARAIRTTAGLEKFQGAIKAGSVGGNVGRNLARADDLGRLAQPGLAGQFLGSGKAAKIGLRPVSNGMDAWRTFTGVQLAKRGIQSSMKAGFLAVLQGDLAPDRDLGYGFGGKIEVSANERLDQFKAWRTTNPIGAPMAAVFEPMFTPVTIFRAGTFVKPFKAVGGGFIERTMKMAQSEAVTSTMHAASERSLLNNPTRLRRFKAYKNQMDAIAYRLTGEEVITDSVREEAAQKTLWMGLVTSIKKNVNDIVYRMGIEPGSLQWHQATNDVEKWFDLRLQDFDIENFDPSDVNQLQKYMARRSGAMDALHESTPDAGKIRAIRTANVEKMIESEAFDPINWKLQAQSEFDHHAQLKVATANDLLAGLEPEDLFQAMQDWGDTLETSWNPWLGAMQDIEQLQSTNYPVRIAGDFFQGFDDDMSGGWAQSLVGEELMQYLPHANTGVLNVADDAFNRMQRGITNSTKRLTAARSDTPTKQIATLFQSSMQRLTRARAHLASVDTGAIPFAETIDGLAGDLDTYAKQFGKTAAALTRTEIQNWAEGVQSVMTRSGKTFGKKELSEVRRFGKAYQFLADQGYGAHKLADTLDANLESINQASFWNQLKVRTEVFDPAKNKNRFTTLEEKMTNLKGSKHLLATEVVVDPDLAEDLAAAGYKVVAGDEFLQFSHIADLESPLTEIKKGFVARRAIGTFLTRQEHSRVNAMRAAIMRQGLSDKATEMFEAGTWTGPGKELAKAEFDQMWAPGSDFIDQLISNLNTARAAGLEAIDSAGEVFKNNVATLGKAMFRTGAQYNIYEMSPGSLNQLLGDVGWDKNSIRALKGIFESSKLVGWEFTGLRAIGDHLSSEGWLRQGLKYMSIHPVADDIADATRWDRTRRRLGQAKRGALGIGSHRDDTDAMRLWRAAGMSTLGVAGGLAYTSAQGGDPLGDWGDFAKGVGAGAVGGAITGLSGPGSLGRTAVRAGLGFGAAQIGDHYGGEMAGYAAFGAAAFPGFSALRRGAAHSANFMSKRAWGEYSRVYEPYERIRNQIRFALSPIFEIQRYTEGFVLGGTTVVKDSEGINRQLALKLKPAKRIMKKFGVTEQDMLNKFNVAARGQEWHDALTMVDARLAEIGIFGYAPQKWMAAAHFQLVEEYGMDAHDAVGKVKEIYQFGEKARTGLEQSVNFVFFPFSFQKQYLTKLTRFVTDEQTGDLARLMAVHDSIKLYQELEQKKEFHRLLQRHVPVLKQLRKVNAMAFGVSPGQFGGINRPFVDAVRSTPGLGGLLDDGFNAMVPNGMEIESVEGGHEMMRVVQQSIPVWRDIEDLAVDMIDQVNVVTTPHHLAKFHEKDEGYAKYGELLDMRERFLQASGLRMTDLNDPLNPTAQGIGRWFIEEERKIRDEYRAFGRAQAESVSYSATRATDLRLITQGPNATEAEINEWSQTGTTSNEELALIDFKNDVDSMLEITQTRRDEAHLLPGILQEDLRRSAIELSRNAPGFIDFYRRFYARSLGPIEKDVTT